MMTTRRTADDLARRILLVMRYFCSSSVRFLCQRSSAVCMLGGVVCVCVCVCARVHACACARACVWWEGRGEGGERGVNWRQREGCPGEYSVRLYLTLICCRSCLRTSLAFDLRASRTALSSSETTGRRTAVLSQMAISLLSSAMCGGSLFLSRT